MKRLNVWAVLFALATMSFTGAAMAADPEPAPDEMTGVKIGETAPDFTLTGVDGKEYTLSKMLEDGPVALMFFRSANW